jgi:hypothetical protein
MANMAVLGFGTAHRLPQGVHAVALVMQPGRDPQVATGVNPGQRDLTLRAYSTICWVPRPPGAGPVVHR